MSEDQSVHASGSLCSDTESEDPPPRATRGAKRAGSMVFAPRAKAPAVKKGKTTITLNILHQQMEANHTEIKGMFNTIMD